MTGSQGLFLAFQMEDPNETLKDDRRDSIDLLLSTVHSTITYFDCDSHSWNLIHRGQILDDSWSRCIFHILWPLYVWSCKLLKDFDDLEAFGGVKINSTEGFPKMIVNFGRHLLSLQHPPFIQLSPFNQSCLEHIPDWENEWSSFGQSHVNITSRASLIVKFPFLGYKIGMGPREVYNQTMVQMVWIV